MIILTSMLKEPGELSKFQALYALYSGSMYAAAYKILNQAEDAEDAVQLSLIKVIRNLDRVTAEEMSDIRTKNFLMTITRNTAIDMYRKRQKQPISSEEIEMEIAPFAPSTEEIFFDRVSVTNLAAAISQLDQKYKDVLRFHYINELSSKEIGELLNLSQFTVNSRLQRARGKLGKIIKEREEGV